MQSIYRSMLKQAFSIALKYKYLWFFGLFTVMFGNGGVYNFILSNFDIVESRGVFLLDLKEFIANVNVSEFNLDFFSFFENFNVFGLALFLFIVFVLLFFVWLSVVSQGALVYSIKSHLNNNKNILFAEAFARGKGKFWPVLLLNILMKVVVFVVLGIAGLPFIILFLMTNGNLIWQNLFVLITFIVLVPIAAVVAFVTRYAVMYVVNNDEHVSEAIKKSWSLFVKNWIVSLELALVLFVLNIITGLVVVVSTIFISLPFVMLGLIASYLASNTFFWLVVIFAVLTMLALVFLYGAVFNVFQTAAWVILFEKINIDVVFSKVLRFAEWFTRGRKKDN